MGRECVAEGLGAEVAEEWVLGERRGGRMEDETEAARIVVAKLPGLLVARNFPREVVVFFPRGAGGAKSERA